MPSTGPSSCPLAWGQGWTGICSINMLASHPCSPANSPVPLRHLCRPRHLSAPHPLGVQPPTQGRAQTPWAASLDYAGVAAWTAS